MPNGLSSFVFKIILSSRSKSVASVSFGRVDHGGK